MAAARDKRKRRVGVIFGGRSGEHEVSLASARSVMQALNKSKYEIVPIGITRDGLWIAGEVLEALTSGEAATSRATILPDPQSGALMQVSGEEKAPSTLSALSRLDVVIPMLHGTYGEDGTVQGLLELANLPYVGAGVVGSAVGMDKAIFKQVMSSNGLPVLPWVFCTRRQWLADRDATIAMVEKTLRYPVFTKPANLGSSVGISKCADRTALLAGLDQAASYDRRVVIEQGINARELEVAVLGNEQPLASIVGEVRPRREFYDYVAKYISDDSELFIPADLEPDVAEAVRRLAIRTYTAIDCAGLGRVDLLLDTNNGDLFVNEINTIPGFTSISMYPKLWEATGVSYTELLDRLIDLALERHEEKSQLKRSFELESEQE